MFNNSSRIFSHFWLIVALLAISTIPSHAQSTPLILEHADLMQGSQSAQKIELTGHIQFKHDQLKVSSQKALWDTGAENLSLQGDVIFEHPAGLLKAQKGFYFKKKKLFKGTGSVWGRDSVGQYLLAGDTVEYYQDLDLLDLRHDARGWRKGRDALDDSFAAFCERDSMKATAP